MHGLAFYGLLEEIVTSLDKSVDLIDCVELIPDPAIDSEIKESGILIYGEARTKGRAMRTIAAMDEFQRIIGEDTGWDSEEEMLKDMAAFRRERVSV